jgi:hypothetical protein
MGSAESIPPVSDQDLARSHAVNNDIRMVSKKMEPDSKALVLYLPKETIAWRKDKRFDIVLIDELSFRGVTAGGHSSGRHVFTLFDTSGSLLAACLRMRTSNGGRYKIYTSQPVFPGQIPSKQVYNGDRLYTYAEVTRSQVTLTSGGPKPLSPYFSVYGSESRRVVKRDGVIAASIELWEESGQYGRRKVSICPGIDPILILCLTGIFDNLDVYDRTRLMAAAFS